MSFTQILPTLRAMELTQEIPVVFAELLNFYNAEVDYVKIGVEDGKIVVKASPTSSQVHVDSIMSDELEKTAELRYTFSPWYVPESLDAHGEWTDRTEVQQAFWDYLADADRSIALQHNMDIVAGKWVEGATWPFEVTVPVKHPEGEREHTYPAGTPFLGVIWEPWAWELVKSGEIRGLSIGGTANRAEAELVLDKENDPTGSVQFAKTFLDAPFVKLADLAKHGTHNQADHGNRDGSVSSTIVSETQRLTAEWGGLSINMVSGVKPTTGFMVAKPPEFSRIVESADFFDKVKGRKILSDYMKANKKDLASGKNFLGTWLNEGKVYLDVSENILDKATAVRLGQERNQLAIYDVAGNDEIPTGGTGSVGKRYQYSSNQGHFGDERQGDRGLRRRALGASDGWQVDKHGDHDQRDHGNRGGSRGATPPKVTDTPASAQRSPEAASAANKLRERASAQSDKTTETMTAIAAEFGGEMEGLQNRLKTTDSLARKIDADAKKDYNGDIDKAASEISDAIRYTMVLDETNYTQGLSSLRDKFTADGYSVRTKNAWQEGNPYMGVNMKLTKDGLTTELQLHTRKSLEVKESQLTPRYQKYRISTDPVERKNLYREMVAISQSVPFPSQAEMLTSLGEASFDPFTPS